MNIEKQTMDDQQFTEQARRQMRDARPLLKSGFIHLKRILSDHRQGFDAPPIQKPYNEDAELISLPDVDASVLKKTNMFECIRDRKSHRKFTDESLTLEELSYLLWATQGIRKLTSEGKTSLRIVPSGGARHPFETYLAINRVDGLKQGLYRYLPLEHQLVYLFAVDHMEATLSAAALDQPYAGNSAVTFIWSAIPYRCEWRYVTEAAKLILQDSGHLCQNLYLACESIGCGTVAIGAYNQDLMDAFIQVDGEDECVVYVAPVGRVA